MTAMKPWTTVLTITVCVSFGVRFVAGQATLFEKMSSLSKADEKLAFIRSLDAGNVWLLASQAMEKGWDDYAVGAGIVDVYFGATWKISPPSAQYMLSIVTNNALHLRLRSGIAASGMKYGQSWPFTEFLQYVDAVMALLEGQDNAAVTIEKIPEHAYRHLTATIDALTASGDIPAVERGKVDELLRRVVRLMNYLTRVVKDAPTKSADPDYVLSYAAAHLSDYVGWSLRTQLPETEDARKMKKAARDGQKILVSVLTDRSYAPVVARAVLNRSERSNLAEMLSRERIVGIKTDDRFSNTEDQQALDSLASRCREKNQSE